MHENPVPPQPQITNPPENTLQPPPTQPDQIQQPEPNKTNPLVLFFIILLLVCVGIGGYFTYQYFQTATPEQTQIIPTSVPASDSPAPTADILSGWSSYENKTGAYSFKYPQNWSLQSSTDSQSALDNPAPNNVLGSELKNADSQTFNNRVSVTVSKINSQNNITAAKEVLIGLSGNEAELNNVSLGGATGYKLVWTYSDPVGSDSRIDYRLENNGLLYEIELSVNDKTPNKQTVYNEGSQILSTFSFTD